MLSFRRENVVVHLVVSLFCGTHLAFEIVVLSCRRGHFVVPLSFSSFWYEHFAIVVILPLGCVFGDVHGILDF